MGTFRSWGTGLTVPGGAQLPGSAVAGVTVRPTHRRRGILGRLMAAELGAARERGESVALLFASEYPIYGRFGFGPAVRSATWVIDTTRTRVRGSTRAGAIAIVPATEAVRDTIHGLFDAWRAQQPGEIWRRDFVWDDDLGLRTMSWGTRWNGFVALHHDAAGAPDGYVRYHVEEKWEQRQPRSILHVDELHALSDEAYMDLWRFVIDLDLVATVRAERRSPTERLPWLLTDARPAVVTDVGDGMWLALLDVPAALAARAYERAGLLVIESVHAAGTAAERRTRMLLDASPDGVTCAPTDRSPDLTLDVAALGSAYLGGARLRDAVLVRGVDEHRPGALAEADALFRTADQPWCSSFF